MGGKAEVAAGIAKSTRLTRLRRPRDHSSAKADTKKPRTMPGLKFAGEIETRSVLREARPAEAVIDARSNHINVLTDRVGAEYAADRNLSSQNASRYEADVAITHEEVIVLNRN